MSSTPEATPAPTDQALTTETITRTTSLGTAYKIEVEHQGDGNVKIISWKRKRPDDRNYSNIKEEEGKTYPLHLLLGTQPQTPDTSNEADQTAA